METKQIAIVSEQKSLSEVSQAETNRAPSVNPVRFLCCGLSDMQTMQATAGYTEYHFKIVLQPSSFYWIWLINTTEPTQHKLEKVIF